MPLTANDVDRFEARKRSHENAVIFDDKIATLDQRHAHLTRQKDVLEIRRIVDTW